MTDAMKNEPDTDGCSLERDLHSKILNEELIELCRAIDLPENVQTTAMSSRDHLLDMIPDEMKNDKHNWNVCIIYIALMDFRMPYGPGDPQVAMLDPVSVTVTDLLKAANVRIGDFFQSMKVVKNCCSLSEAVLQHLLQVEKKYLITCPLFIKFEKMFDEIFDKECTISDTQTDSGDDGYEERKKFCWMLFIYMKSASREQRGGRSELVFSFHLLLCCIEYVIRLTPSFQLRQPFDAARISGTFEACILQELCDRYQANAEEVKLVQSTYVCAIIEQLPLRNGIIDVDQVVNSYHSSYQAAGDINELDFLTHEPYLVIRYAVGREPMLHDTGGTTGGALRPSNQLQPATPIRCAMTSIQHLACLLQQSDDGPSNTLIAFMKRCAVNPLPLIEKRLSELQAPFVTRFTSATGGRVSSFATMRFSLASRLYFRVLEALLRTEEERLGGPQDFSRLLNKSIFHECLLACSAEVVLVTYEAQASSSIQSPAVSRRDSSNLLFPWILGVFGLNAFDFLKVLESFIRVEPELSPEVIKHLQHVETQILEQLAWQLDSPLFNLLQNYEGPRPSITLTGSPSNQRDALESTTTLQENSPTSRHNADHSSDNPSILESPSISPRRSHSLNLFLNKVFKLAHHRLQHLCTMLGVTADLLHKIWTCFEYCITQRSSLLQGRHLDQIIMCCIYAVCKVVDKEIKFKSIVSMYRLMPHTSQEVYKNVMISGGEFDSIINFYNKVFMQSLKTFILHLGSSGIPSVAQAAALKPMASPQRSSPKYTLPGRQNFYISPMKGSPFKSPMSPSHMTPRTRQLYSFGEGPLAGEKLRAINERMRMSLPSSGSRSSKCLLFDQSDSSIPVPIAVFPTSEHANSDTMKRKMPASRKSLTFDETATS